MSRYEIRLSGSGGQGLIFAGIILAEAAGIHEGKYVCQTQSYGPEARGGASKAEASSNTTVPAGRETSCLRAENLVIRRGIGSG